MSVTAAQWQAFANQVNKYNKVTVEGLEEAFEVMGMDDAPKNRETVVASVNNLGISLIEGFVIARSYSMVEVANFILSMVERDFKVRMKEADRDLEKGLAIREQFKKEQRVEKLSSYKKEMSEIRATLGVFYDSEPPASQMDADEIEQYARNMVSDKCPLKQQFTLLKLGQGITNIAFVKVSMNNVDLRALLGCLSQLTDMNLNNVSTITRHGLRHHGQLRNLSLVGTGISEEAITTDLFPKLERKASENVKRVFYWEEQFDNGSNLVDLEISKCTEIYTWGFNKEKLEPYYKDFIENPTVEKITELLALCKLRSEVNHDVARALLLGARCAFNNLNPTGINSIVNAINQLKHEHSVVVNLLSLDTKMEQYEMDLLTKLVTNSKEYLGRMIEYFKRLHSKLDEDPEGVIKTMKFLVDWFTKCFPDPGKNFEMDGSYEPIKRILEKNVAIDPRVEAEVMPVVIASVLALSLKYPERRQTLFFWLDKLPQNHISTYFRMFKDPVHLLGEEVPESLQKIWAVEFMFSYNKGGSQDYDRYKSESFWKRDDLNYLS